MERSKEYIERRVIGPVNSLFLPKMGFLASQASTKKSIVASVQLNLLDIKEFIYAILFIYCCFLVFLGGGVKIVWF